MAARPKLIAVRGRPHWLFVESKPVDDPACVRDDNDPQSAFAQYLLTRLRRSHDEASKEVLAAVKAGRSVSDAALDAIQSLPASKTRRLRVWMEEASSSQIYPYASIDGINGAARVGLLLTEGGPKDRVIQNEETSHYGIEDFAPYHYFKDVIGEIEDGHISSDESLPVLIETKAEFDRAMAALSLRTKWAGPGIYEFMEGSFLGDVNAYEDSAAFMEAEFALEDQWPTGKELKDACAELRRR
jgi:hypothetical protein